MPKMTTGELLTRIERLFYIELEKKTGWGRNDIKEVYRSCVNQALQEFIDKIEEHVEERYETEQERDVRLTLKHAKDNLVP